MRRIAATLLLFLTGILPLQPLVSQAEAQASLPACCRTHGKHHCMMRMQLAFRTDGPASWTPQPCPYSRLHHAVTTSTTWMGASTGNVWHQAAAQPVYAISLHLSTTRNHLHRIPRGPPIVVF
ncbi:MAG TPA: hypothetical protein VHX63_03940 [Acidobacteriaceae bacterium]|nr:hypothetical protein [Acidobacteriaceae bacterium]